MKGEKGGKGNIDKGHVVMCFAQRWLSLAAPATGRGVKGGGGGPQLLCALCAQLNRYIAFFFSGVGAETICSGVAMTWGWTMPAAWRKPCGGVC